MPVSIFLHRPKNKFIRITKDESFSSELHYLSNTPAMAKAACSYDLDQVDEAWLNILNGERTMAGMSAVTEEQFERVVEELEVSVARTNGSSWGGNLIFGKLIRCRSSVGIKFRQL